ncbi:hypothetical protein BC830DRAFT_1062362 [Chytriomyces sp. MP71]|nr:hypothetical protein BC830DRAFT_1062362 [Chytriomyces sp. MP71]
MQARIYQNAETLYVKCVKMREMLLGREHPDTLTSINNLALLYDSQDKYNQAEPLYQEYLQAKEKFLGKEDSSTLDVRKN